MYVWMDNQLEELIGIKSLNKLKLKKVCKGWEKAACLLSVWGMSNANHPVCVKHEIIKKIYWLKGQVDTANEELSASEEIHKECGR